MMPLNHSLLRKLCSRSLTTLGTQFDVKMNTHAVVQLKNLTADENCPHTTHLALFFLLLNVDQKLKEDIMKAENKHMHPKLTRFFLDLKDEAVRPYFCDESLSNECLVAKAEELWTLA